MMWLVLRYMIFVLGMANILRMAVYLIGSDAYTLKRAYKSKQQRKTYYRPTVSIIVPAHNEAAVIEHTLEALHKSNYPTKKLQIIVANDGSTDDTAKIVKRFMARRRRSGQPYFQTILMNQKNGGKADAMNNAIRRYATGTLVMCLDADSLIDAEGVKNAVQYFRDRSVAALASNVNIIEDGTLLGLAQRFEYLISYQMKKAQTTLNTEYIIGGIGSMFRRRMLQRVNYYDTNTMTEDIDLTMKIIVQGNRKHRVVYASDCITYTEPVPSFKSLVTQRFRWKYGRLQTFLKHPNMFFNTDRKYAKQLTWFILPYALFQETLFILEPLMVGFILVTSIMYRDPITLLTAAAFISGYISLNVWASEHLSVKERMRLTVLAPVMYLLLYMMAVVEYAALIRTIRQLHKLPQSIRGERTTWTSPERSAIAAK